MAALPYIQLYVSDYLADTMHLTTEEHGAYLLLIMNYWQTGKPIKISRLQAISKLSNERWNSVEDTLKEFFSEEDGYWYHDRIEGDLNRVKSKSIQASKAGKKSAEARKAKKQSIETKEEFNGRSNSVERKSNHTDTDTDTDTDTYIKPNTIGDFSNEKVTRIKVPFKKIVDLYHKMLPELPRVEKLTKTREGFIRQRYIEDLKKLEHWENFFDHVSKSSFLMGKVSNGDRPPFRADLEWLCRPNNFAKIAEDKYHG